AARARLARSPALGAAVARGNARATRAALEPLLRGQIKRIVIRRDGRTLVALGHAPALAPVSGSIAGAQYTFSVATASGRVKLGPGLTGERVTIASGGSGVPVVEFPDGNARLDISGPTPCESPAAVIAGVGRRLMHGELAGPHARHVVHLVGTDPRF